jgi:hypothetical protein
MNPMIVMRRCVKSRNSLAAESKLVPLPLRRGRADPASFVGRPVDEVRRLLVLQAARADEALLINSLRSES